MNIDENAVTNKVIATLLDNRSFEIKLNLPKPLIFETFEEKIQRDLSKEEIKELLKVKYSDIIYNEERISRVNIECKDFTDDIKLGVCKFHQNNIDFYQKQIDLIKQNFGLKYPEIFI
jgi:hypothetical protein